MKKLDSGEMNMLRLAQKEADSDGWAKVSNALWPFIQAIPDDLVERRQSNDGGHVRLTDQGIGVVNYG